MTLTDRAVRLWTGRFHRDQTTLPRGTWYPTVLNPAFCDWLMGWPAGWTAFERLDPASFRSWQRQHSCTLAAALG